MFFYSQAVNPIKHETPQVPKVWNILGKLIHPWLQWCPSYVHSWCAKHSCGTEVTLPIALIYIYLVLTQKCKIK